MSGSGESSPPYRRCVGLVVFNRDGLVFVGERRDTPGAWQMPQGGIKQDEPLEISARRELLEEIGTDQADLLDTYPGLLRYEFPDYLVAQKGNTLYHGKYRGQEQAWMAFLLTAPDSAIDLSGKFYDEPPEFVAWKWVELAETPRLIVDFKRPVYDAVATYLAPWVAKIKAQQ